MGQENQPKKAIIQADRFTIKNRATKSQEELLKEIRDKIQEIVKK